MISEGAPEQMPVSVTDLSERATDAVTAAAHVVAHLATDLERIVAESKDDRSPVTVADFAAQAIVGLSLRGCGVEALVGEEDAAKLRENTLLRDEVVRAVQRALPDATEDDVLAAIDSGDHAGGPTGCFWTLDPIDGTKGFLRGGQFALALGLIEDGQVQLGVLGLPHWGLQADPSGGSVQVPGSICMATLGGGAQAWSLQGGDPVQLHVAEWAQGDTFRTCESVESAHTSHDTSAQINEAFGAHEAVRLDSQTKYAVVAAGAADAYLRLPTRPGYVERIWDHAAGALVATEAGAVVSDIHGKALNFSLGRGLEENKGVICAVPEAHRLILKRIEELDLG